MGIYWHGKKEPSAMRIDLSKYLTNTNEWYISDEWEAIGKRIREDFEKAEKGTLNREWKKGRRE